MLTTTMRAESLAGYGAADFFIDPGDERLFGPNGPVRLGNKAFQVLLRLVERGGRLVTKDELMSSVWDGTIVTEFSLTSAIKELRRVLGDDARAPRFIESVYGRGYRLLGPIRAIDAAARVPNATSATARGDPARNEAVARMATARGAVMTDAARPFAAADGRRESAARGSGQTWTRLTALFVVLMSLGSALTLADAAGGHSPSLLRPVIQEPQCRSV